jgi:hypothetical protein
MLNNSALYQKEHIMLHRKIIAAVLLTISLGACTSTYLQQSYTDPIAYNLTQPQLQQAIMEAGISRGWIMTPVNPGEINAELNIRAHKVITLVKYDATSFSINYVDSVNMNAKNGKIHRQYANWINNLRQDIKVKMNLVSYQNATK